MCIRDSGRTLTHLEPETLRLAKRHGFSDAQIGELVGLGEAVVRGVRQALDIRPVYKTVDTLSLIHI